ncbi:GDSL-type esterase/lipase family protein [Mangrovibacterium diazotrophicum]|uniref:Lysophospholipase L1-like esterase n=1 Tax=Mangrovibacterium diazotrophicum TaxID=1261403 RepID=A0A419W9Y2_9BACT|nr:GDSL-type esterase/lipase family protein [Mangrovibacterium diazotrophicum]RKD92224.1 lysophospholipase L1-like esterase [Mangrovibacterium diazotrophicum]
MKFVTQLLCFVFFSISILSCQQQTEQFVDLDGKVLNKADAASSEVPYLQISDSKSTKGIVVLYPSNDANDSSVSSVFQQMGFAVATLRGDSLKTADVIKAFRLVKAGTNLNLNSDYTSLVGCSDGAKLVALAENNLNESERPDNLILINPSNFEETTFGTVFPVVNPPLGTKTNLLCIADTLVLDQTALIAASEYTKTWIGYDGVAFWKEIGDAEDKGLAEALTSFLNGEMVFPREAENPAAVPVEGYSPQRHAEKVALVKNHKYDLLFVGNSITNNFEKPEYQPIWKKYYGSRNAVNLGFSGYRTENIIWNIENGELENQSPKVIVLEIGTNNIDEKNYPTRHTAGQLAGGIEKIVSLLREKCPEAKIIVLRCFPGCYGGPNPTSHRRILERASDLVSHLADNKHVFYCDVNHVFLNMDGSINHDMLGDWLHPTPAGAEAWAQAMEPLLSELMGDKSHDDQKPQNTAIIPASKLEQDSYDWWVRHHDVLAVKDSLNPEIVLIGNSITHFWGGQYPPLKYADGAARKPNGPNSWEATFGGHRVLNLGFGWDRTQNVLWRLDHGELDGLDPKLVVIHIGTNNTSQTQNARMNTAPEIAEGVKAVCMRVRSKVARAKIVLMQIMPREEMPDNPRRVLINETNKILQQFATENEITLLDISSQMLTPEGILTKEIAGDFCHPTDAGYQIWGDALRPYIDGIVN